MITESSLILGLISVFIIIGLVIVYKIKTYSIEDLIVKWFLGGLISFICSMLITLGIFTVFRWLDADVTHTYKETVNIASLKNSSEAGGSFTLGCGSIEQTEYYYYYKFDGVGYTRGKKEIDKTVIIERYFCIPHIEVLYRQYHSKTGLIKYNDEEREVYRIIVPKNTIVNKYQVY